jgi:hypothetical protein
MKAVSVATSDARLVDMAAYDCADKRSAKAIKDLIQGSSKDNGPIQPGQL